MRDRIRKVNNFERLLNEFVDKYELALGGTAVVERYIDNTKESEHIRLVVEGPRVVTLYIDITPDLIRKSMMRGISKALIAEVINEIDKLDIDDEYNLLYPPEVVSSLDEEKRKEFYDLVSIDVKYLEGVKESLEEEVDYQAIG